MKKNELIDLLSKIPGNPEVVFWNGLVDDYMHLSPELKTIELVKHDKEWLRNMLNLERKERGVHDVVSDERLNFVYKTHYSEWVIPNRYMSESEMSACYGKKRKNLLVINSTLRGKTYRDRVGKIFY